MAFPLGLSMRLLPLGTSLTAGGQVSGPNLQPRGYYIDVFGMGGRMGTGYGFGGLVGLQGVTSGTLMPGSVALPYAAHKPTLAEIGGATAASLLAAWGTLVTPYEPVDGYLLEGFINDVAAGTNTTAFRATFREMLVRTGNKPVLYTPAMLGYIPNGENDTLFGDAFNTSLEAYNTICFEECAAAGSRVTAAVNVRAGLKLWEQTYNTGHAGSGLLTIEGVHLTEWGIGVVTGLLRPYVAWS